MESQGNFALPPPKQHAPTQDFDDGVTAWQSLGIFRIVDGTLSVVLTDDADGTVVADGVRVVERPPTSNTVYNAVGEVTSTTDALGRATTREYDAQGRVVKEIYPDPDGAGAQQSPEMLYEYDLYDRLVKQTYVLADADDLVTEYEYDDLHRKILERDGNGDETHFAYDLIGNLLSKTDAEGNVTAYEYDAWDRVTKETITVDSVALTRLYKYDHENNLIEMTDRNGRTFQYDYDALDRVVAERWYDGAAIAANLSNTIFTVYDKHNRVHSQRDDFSAYTYSYDDLDRVVSVANFIDNNGDGDSADAGDFTTPGVADVLLTYDYDEDNRLIETAATIDGVNDFVNNYAYNGRDYLTSVEQTSQTGGNGVAYKRVELQFDAADQLDQILRYASTGTSQLVASSSFTYDDASRLTAITHAQGSNTLGEFRWQYDTANRVSAFSSLVDGTAFYTYDDRDQLTGEFYVDQYFDANGDFTAIASGGYDSSFQNNLAYQYDENGNRLRRAEVALPDIFDPNHASFAPTTQFTPIGTADDAETYTESGVAVTATDDFSTDAGTHNRIDTDGTHDYLFDAQGNRSRRTHIANDTVTVYTWDVRNRLVEVADYASTADADAKTNATQVVEHAYDVNDQWLGKKVDTDGDGDVDVTERYVYDGNQIALHFVDEDANDETEGDELANRYLWGQAVDQLFAQENVNDLVSSLSNEVLFALADNLNSVRDLVQYDAANDETEIVDHITYQGFGKVTSQTNLADPVSDPTGSTFLYTGRIFESYTGLQSNHYRWYDFATGQWMSPDPADGDRANTYRYVSNNPIGLTDPSGLDPYLDRENELYFPSTESRDRVDAPTLDLQKIPADRVQGLIKAGIAREFSLDNYSFESVVVTPFILNGESVHMIMGRNTKSVPHSWTTHGVGGSGFPAPSMTVSGWKIVPDDSFRAIAAVPSVIPMNVAVDNEIRHPRNLKNAVMRANLATTALHLLPGGTLADYAVNGEGTLENVIVATLGDATLLLGGVVKAIGTGRTAIQITRATIVIEGGLGVYSGVQSARLASNGDLGSASIAAADATLRLLGVIALRVRLPNDLPQGLNVSKFNKISSELDDIVRARNLGNEVVIQGSRARQTATGASDIDIAILVDDATFEREWNKAFGRFSAKINPATGKPSANFRTGQHARRSGKIQRGEAKLSNEGKALEALLGMEVDVSIIRKSSFNDFPVIRTNP